MTTANIQFKCPRCFGTGIDDNGVTPVTCVPCGGTGYRDRDRLDITDIMTAIADVMDKCNDIKEKVDEIKEVVDEL